MEKTGFLRLSFRLQLVGHLVDLRRMIPVVVEHVVQKNDGPFRCRRVAMGVIMLPVIAEVLVRMDVLMRVDVGMPVGVGRAVRMGMGVGMFVGVLVTVAAVTLVLVFFVH